VSATEVQLDQLRRAIGDAAPPGPRPKPTDLELLGALEELAAWIADDQEASGVFAAHWASLLGDLLWTADQCGPRVRAALLADEPGLLCEMQACRSILRNVKGPPDLALRRRIARATQSLARKVSDGELLGAAFEDVAETTFAEASLAYAELFVALCAEVGHDPRWFPSRVRSILADDAYAISVERGEPARDQRSERAGASPDERIAIVRRLLAEPPSRGDVAVWLRFANAALGWPPILDIGDSVKLFEARWLRAVMHNDRAQLEPHAPEAMSERSGHDIELFVGEEPDEEERDDPWVFVRVVVHDSTAVHALRTARRTADAISGLATLYGTPPRLWELDNSYVVRAAEGGGGSGFSAPPSRELSVDDWAALRNDHTGRNLADMADKLGPHLPVTDPAIFQAATLLSWLRGARAAAAAPRLLLCDRVVEQVSGWAGFGDPKAFSSEVLRVTWAVSRVRNAVADAAFAAGWELRWRGHASLAEEFGDLGGSWGGTVNLKRFLELFDAVVDELGDDPENVERVHRLAPRLRSPAASLKWLREQYDDYARLEARRRRTRNSLVHGGPLAERTVEATVNFAESLAVHALGDCIDGRLSHKDLVDHFLEQRAHRDNIERRLAADDPLHEALFWDPAE
jgi:hypothetical protein